MATDFKVPNLGENVDEGDITKVMVKEGDEITADQSVMEIETGKAVVELPCPIGGRITKVHVQEGAKVKVGDPLLTVEGADGAAAKQAPAAKPAAKSKKTETAQPVASKAKQEKPKRKVKTEDEDIAEELAEAAEAEEPTAADEAEIAAKVDARPSRASAKQKAGADEGNGTAQHTSPGKIPPAGPATRRLARELGVDLFTVAGSGPHGRITEDDVKAAVRETTSTPRAAVPSAPLPSGTDEKDPWGLVRRQKMSGIRKAIAHNMARSSADDSPRHEFRRRRHHRAGTHPQGRNGRLRGHGNQAHDDGLRHEGLRPGAAAAPNG